MNFTSNLVSGFKTRRKKFGIGSLALLLLFGVVFTSIGVLVIRSINIDESWPRVTGEVVSASSSINDGSTTYTPVIQYKIDGKTYRITSSSGSSTYPAIGVSRQVAYNPAQPNDAKVVESLGSTWWLYIFPAVGVICLIIAPVAFVRSQRRSGAIQRLIQSGQKIQGVVTEIPQNGNNSYTIVVSATDLAGNVQNYVSDSLDGVGSLIMADFRNNPIPIDVYVNPTNPQEYYVDISDVPNLTPERIAELIQSARKPNTFAQNEQPTQSLQAPVTTSPAAPVLNDTQQPRQL